MKAACFKLLLYSALFGAASVLTFTSLPDVMSAALFGSMALWTFASALQEYMDVSASLLREELRVLQDANSLKKALTLEGMEAFFVDQERYEDAAIARRMIKRLEDVRITQDGTSLNATLDP